MNGYDPRVAGHLQIGLDELRAQLHGHLECS
jgi:hypothetical protein